MPPADTDAAEAEASAGVADAAREAVVEAFRTALPDAVLGVELHPGRDLWVRVATSAWADAAQAARHQGFSFFSFLSVIDWMPSPFGRSMDAAVDSALHGEAPREPAEQETGYAGGDTRFQAFARVMDPVRHLGVTLKADIPDDSLTIASWSALYAGANWHERESWEMFGITFAGHPNLGHIYLPSDFEGHPLRKDYPLVARMVKPWPGIVDVEGMPGEDEADGGDAAAGDAAAGDAA